MGEGYFVTSRNIWYVGDEVVATMLFRVLKFIPQGAAVTDAPTSIRPMVNRDSQFFWDGTQLGELRIQKCNACGALRFPPGPACPSLRARIDRGYVVASRHRHRLLATSCTRTRRCPGKELPIVIALIDLDEGVRMVGEVVGVPDDETSRSGRRCAWTADEVDDELTLPIWRRA